MSETPGYQRFFAELKRRRVFRVMAVYGVVGFVLLQVVDLAVPALLLPEWTYRLIALILVIGFPIALIIAWAFEVTPEGLRRTEALSDAALDAIVAQPAGQRWPAGILGLIGGLAIATAGWWALAPRHGSTAGEAAMEAAAAAGRDRDVAPPSGPAPEDVYVASLAVLPFDNRSADPENEFFTEGVHDDILTALSRLEGLKLISRTSVMRYKDTELGIPEIGRELGVATVMEGGVQRSGDRVRITVQLIDAGTDNHLWAATYDEELTAANVFAIQTDVARKIVEALETTLVADSTVEAFEPPTESLAAYDKLIEARVRLATRRPADMFQSVNLFREAIELDPSYAEAYTGLAEAHLILHSWDQIPFEEAEPVVVRSLDRALELNPRLPEAHNVRALYLRNLGRIDDSEEEWKTALDLAPGLANAHHWYGIMLWELGRFEESQRQMRQALALDPMSRIINTNVGLGLYMARDYEAAIERYRQALERFPDWDYTLYLLARAYSLDGRHDEAIETMSRAVELARAELARAGQNPSGNRNWSAGMAEVLARAGRAEAARDTLRAIEGRADPTRLAIAYAAVGDTGEALRHLEQAVAIRSPFTSELGDPAYDPIRDDPRFRAIVREAGLPE
jgi:TolB-like protein